VKIILAGDGKASVPVPAVPPACPVPGAIRVMPSARRGCHMVSRPRPTKRAGVISDRGWAKEFGSTIEPPDGRRLRTLREAIQYLGKTVPKSEHLHPKVQTAATSVTDAAEGRDFMMHARIAVLQAIHRNDGPPVSVAYERLSSATVIMKP
jgi:hypothetical protein